MKRKLISHEVFDSIKNNSLSAAEKELVEAKHILAKALQVENLSLVCYGNEDVMFETNDGSYVHANYRVHESNIAFDNIEQLTIDESSEDKHALSLLNDMLDAVVDGNNAKANEFFDAYINTPRFKRSRKNESVNESVAHKAKKKTVKKSKVNAKLNFKSKGLKDKKIREWSNLLENVNNYVDLKKNGHVIKESIVGWDNKGNVNSVAIPTVKTRNEAKILTFNWKTLDSEVKVLRGSAKHLSENMEFCKGIANLKRQNAISDTEKFQEALDDVISRWSNVLYLTHGELAQTVAEALSTVGAKNFDDETCDFIAEALLRTAYEQYVDKVSKIVTLAGAKIEEGEEDPYTAFTNIASAFYPHLDESASLDMQAYVDLYDALREIYSNTTNAAVKNETVSHLKELAAIIEQEIEPSLDVAVAAAEWLTHIVETNLESEDWAVSNSTHVTINGEHPKASQWAKKGYTPSSDFSGDWGDSAPVSDGKNYKGGLADEMRGNSWGNIGGNNTYPSLNNPYMPKAGEFKIKGEKDVDADSNQLAHWGSNDTWPALQNPYMPHSETPQSYKAKETDLVVDK